VIYNYVRKHWTLAHHYHKKTGGGRWCSRAEEILKFSDLANFLNIMFKFSKKFKNFQKKSSIGFKNKAGVTKIFFFFLVLHF